MVIPLKIQSFKKIPRIKESLGAPKARSFPPSL
jgi:hypothetical protein